MNSARHPEWTSLRGLVSACFRLLVALVVGFHLNHVIGHVATVGSTERVFQAADGIIEQGQGNRGNDGDHHHGHGADSDHSVTVLARTKCRALFLPVLAPAMDMVVRAAVEHAVWTAAPLTAIPPRFQVVPDPRQPRAPPRS